ncbi:hypothetical protein EV44_g5497 [Erysiphe necator]|uniref:CCHC-type domain-containing protein n=1 Tax=Uncinula necator TaxID=52586 RepID=A0A0B1P006_UNCNE|nr:hypothetical protein EV44_g5497 [Erysiphe necator]
MSDSNTSAPPNIFSLNKKLNDSLVEIDTRFKNLEKSIELGHINTSGRIEKIEKRLDKMETRNTNIEKIVIQIQKSLNSQFKIEEDPKEPKEKSVQKAEKNDSIKRDNQGRIKLSDFQNIENLSVSDKFVKRAWPEAIFPKDIQDDAFASVKNKVVLKPEWRLVVANGEIFDKLLQIQNALQMALIPYHMWAKRVAMDMGGDFHGVRIWSSGKNLTWIELLEAIFTTMQRLNVLHSPFTTFSLIIPNKNESPHAFAWRLREAFYKLSGTDRESDSTRELLKELIMNHLPRVWTLTSQNIKLADNYEIIEMAVQIASQVVKWSTEVDTFALNKQTATSPSDNIASLSSDVNIFSSKEECHSHEPNDTIFLTQSNNCYRCGQKGHWANNCHATQNTSRQNNSNFNRFKNFNNNGSSSSLTQRFNALRTQPKNPNTRTTQHYKRPKTPYPLPHKTYLINTEDMNEEQMLGLQKYNLQEYNDQDDSLEQIEEHDFEELDELQ